MIPGIDRRVTVMLNTVRESDAAGNACPLRTLGDQLAVQTFPAGEMELVAVDGVHPWRSDALTGVGYPFRTVHVLPRDTPMVRDRRCAISAYKNTAIIHARGELLITVDDCGVIGPEYVERTWLAWAERRECLSAFYVNQSGREADSRTSCLGVDGKCVGPLGGNFGNPPMYGFAAFPLEAALAVNGYDELFDGSQGLEDVDMGHRLQQAGYRVALDRTHTFSLINQGGWSPRIFGESPDPLVKCCNHTLLFQRGRRLVRANDVPWPDEYWKKISPRCHLLTVENRCTYNGHVCSYVGKFSDRAHPGLTALREEQPIFDLAEWRNAKLKELS